MHRHRYEQQQRLMRERRELINKSIRDKENRVKQVMQSIEVALQNLTGREEQKIQSDPTIRKKFAQLCSIMEVDPLLISKCSGYYNYVAISRNIHICFIYLVIYLYVLQIQSKSLLYVELYYFLID